MQALFHFNYKKCNSGFQLRKIFRMWPAGIYLFKVDNKDNDIVLLSLVNFEQILHIVLVFPLLTLNM